ncbi:MAG TPA: efflux RND transporter periplasmic adaptor subunit [Verrucomicrobiales bacterium]|nr:efflux RND transporter periplasmic adaptor subunit [Verrucomicrobiales bacterium]HIL72529.1 efflux RND transporter periplasmic adaptor subunit [Verrucomicrobiota bacterium]
MIDNQKKSRLIGKIIGGVLMFAAVLSVFLMDWKKTPEVKTELIRPLKTLVLESAFGSGGGKYPGTIRPSRQVELSFEVQGVMNFAVAEQILENSSVTNRVVRRGSRVKKGTVLARLDKQDYQNILAAAIAEKDRALAQLERVKEAAKTNAVSQQDVSDAQATFDIAKAKVKIQQRALGETDMIAPFDGVVANTYFEDFENIRAKQPILSFQSVVELDIDVNIPEQRVLQVKRGLVKTDWTYSVYFDSLPEKGFPTVIKEFSTDADPATQTYKVTFTMQAPTDLMVLPGMTVTVHETSVNPTITDTMEFLLPLNFVPVDEADNEYFVWLVEESGSEVYTVKKRFVKVKDPSKNNVVITEGLKIGDRIATAGVHILREGQKVKLLDTRS